MKIQIDHVEQRDGHAAAVDYARRSFNIYRECARNHNHFAHNKEFVRAYAKSLKFLKNYLKQNG